MPRAIAENLIRASYLSHHAKSVNLTFFKILSFKSIIGMN